MNILICGSGPAAVQFALLLERFYSDASISFFARDSQRNKELLEFHRRDQLEFSISSQNPELVNLGGSIRPSHFYTNITNVDEQYDLIVLAVPIFRYLELLESLLERSLLKRDGDVITASSYLGTGAALENALSYFSKDAGLVLFGDFFSISVRSTASSAEFLLSDMKSYLRLYHSESIRMQTGRFLDQVFLPTVPELQSFSDVWEVEQGNTNIFHVPLVVHDALDRHFFDPTHDGCLFYAPFPAGSMSYETIVNSMTLEKEVESVFSALQLSRFNFFEFRLDRAKLERPCVETETLKNYPNLSVSERATIYTLYSWVTERKMFETLSGASDLDSKGLPRFPKLNPEVGRAILPRIPLEDYVCLKGLVKFARRIGLSLPMAQELCSLFEEKCRTLPERFGYVLDFEESSFERTTDRYAEVFWIKAQGAKN